MIIKFKIYELNNMKEIIKISDLEKRIRDGEDIDLEEILIEIPDGQILTIDEYLDGGYNVLYSDPDPYNTHNTSPLLKDKSRRVPDGVGSKKKRTKKKYWEE